MHFYNHFFFFHFVSLIDWKKYSKSESQFTSFNINLFRGFLFCFLGGGFKLEKMVCESSIVVYSYFFKPLKILWRSCHHWWWHRLKNFFLYFKINFNNFIYYFFIPSSNPHNLSDVAILRYFCYSDFCFNEIFPSILLNLKKKLWIVCVYLYVYLCVCLHSKLV